MVEALAGKPEPLVADSEAEPGIDGEPGAPREDALEAESVVGRRAAGPSGAVLRQAAPLVQTQPARALIVSGLANALSYELGGVLAALL